FMVTPRIIISKEEEMRLAAEQLPGLQKAAAAKPAVTDADAEESVCPSPEKCRACCPPCHNSNSQRLGEAYRGPGPAGKRADAKRLGTEALSIDPTCFSKGK